MSTCTYFISRRYLGTYLTYLAKIKSKWQLCNSKKYFHLFFWWFLNQNITWKLRHETMRFVTKFSWSFSRFTFDFCSLCLTYLEAQRNMENYLSLLVSLSKQNLKICSVSGTFFRSFRGLKVAINKWTILVFFHLRLLEVIPFSYTFSYLKI